MEVVDAWLTGDAGRWEVAGVAAALLAAALLAAGTRLQAVRWWAGTALLGAGAGCGALALALAPVALVQPLGVLALPASVWWGVRRGGGRVPVPLLVAVAMCVLGVVGFVTVAGAAAPSTGPGAGVGARGGSVLAVTLLAAALLAGAGAHATGRYRALASAAASGTAFGAVAVLTKVLVTTAWPGAAGADLGPAASLGVVVLLGASLLLGLWSLARAHDSGSPELVVGTLTVADPLVAVLLAAAVLGEPLPTTAPAAPLALLAALLAVVGTVRLAGSTDRRPPPGGPAGAAPAPPSSDRPRPAPDRSAPPQRPRPARRPRSAHQPERPTYRNRTAS